MLILKIIGGIIVIAILWGLGFIPEFLIMAATSLIIGLLSGVITFLFNWGGFNTGYEIGIWIGVGLYAISCITRIVSDEVVITFYTDGSSEKTSPRASGIIGLIVLIISVLITIFN